MRFSAGASDERIRYSLSKRWVMKAIQAMPASTQITGSFGNRSGSPFITQLARCTMLPSGNDSACIDRKRLV